MGVIRKTLALLAWLVIYIPTTLFVVAVMIKVYFEQRRSRRKEPNAQPSVSTVIRQEEQA